MAAASDTASHGSRTSGVVISRAQLLSEVELADGRVLLCATRRNIEAPPGEEPAASAQDRRGRLPSPLVVGDRVEVWLPPGEGTPLIERIERRKNALRRRAAGPRGGEQILFSNIDLLCVVAPAADPPPNPGFIDRCLVLAEDAEIPAAIVFTKMDLASDDAVSDLTRLYESVGYSVLTTSSVSALGISALADRLAGLTAAVIGPSGAGKSSLLNAISPGLGQKVGEVSESTGKGKHTTTSARFFAIELNGNPTRIADTPGVREMGLWKIPPLRLAWCMPDLRLHLDRCRFGGSCTHTHESACAVKAALDTGTIHEGRYRSYLRMLEDGRA